MTKRICKRGHDTSIVGRYKSNSGCKICAKVKRSLFKLKNPDYDKNWEQSHKKERLQYHINYNHAHRKERNAFKVHKVKSDFVYKARCYLRSRLYKLIKRDQKSGSAVRDLGCSVPDLKIYLESKFKSGMSWSNWGSGKDKWNIDHVIPLSSFDLSNRSQFLKAVHYTNLQPLWSVDNLKKSNKF